MQIALAAVIHSASKNGHNLDTYVTDVLFGSSDDNNDESEVAKRNEKIMKIIEAVRNIRVMVKNIDRSGTQSLDIKKLFQTLEGCRNQDNNPDSQA